MRRAALLLLAGHAVGGVTQVNLRGLSPELAEQVKRYSSLSCDGASREVPVARFNDDYCDCADGADEPGACQAKPPSGATREPAVHSQPLPQAPPPAPTAASTARTWATPRRTSSRHASTTASAVRAPPVPSSCALRRLDSNVSPPTPASAVCLRLL
jgi:hypothetical protein